MPNDRETTRLNRFKAILNVAFPCFSEFNGLGSDEIEREYPWLHEVRRKYWARQAKAQRLLDKVWPRDKYLWGRKIAN